MFWTVTQSLLGGLWTTFEIFILTLIFALPLGLILAFGSMSKFKPLRYLVQLLVWVIRGTPLMLQLIIIFYGPGLWLSHNIWSGNEAGRITATVVAFAINYACYFSVIFRGGIEGVPAGHKARRGRQPARCQGLPLDRQDPPQHHRRGPDLSPAPPRHLLHRGSG